MLPDGRRGRSRRAAAVVAAHVLPPASVSVAELVPASGAAAHCPPAGEGARRRCVCCCRSNVEARHRRGRRRAYHARDASPNCGSGGVSVGCQVLVLVPGRRRAARVADRRVATCSRACRMRTRARHAYIGSHVHICIMGRACPRVCPDLGWLYRHSRARDARVSRCICHVGLPHKWGSVPDSLSRGCAVRCVRVSRSAPSREPVSGPCPHLTHTSARRIYPSRRLENSAIRVLVIQAPRHTP